MESMEGMECMEPSSSQDFFLDLKISGVHTLHYPPWLLTRFHLLFQDFFLPQHRRRWFPFFSFIPRDWAIAFRPSLSAFFQRGKAPSISKGSSVLRTSDTD